MYVLNIILSFTIVFYTIVFLNIFLFSMLHVKIFYLPNIKRSKICNDIEIVKIHVL